MATIGVGVDWINGQASDSKLAKKVVELLNNAGHTATYVGWGPNTIQSYARKNSLDIMLQIAGGKCFGTLGDFYYGTQSHYYKAKGFAFLYYNCWSETWAAKREPRDTFSWGLDLSRWQGKTLPWIFNDMKNTLGKKAYYGYGTNAEGLVKTFLSNLGGSTSTNTTGSDSNGGGGGSSILDLMKQVLSDIDPYGAELTLTGNTVNIRKTDIGSAVPLRASQIANNSESFTEYDISTPNKYRNVEDTMLSKRYGVMMLDESEVNAPTSDNQLVLCLAQRGHGHTIDIKCLFNPNFMEGKWVRLTHPQLGITDRLYYITKTGLEEELYLSITLEPGPPSRYMEVTEDTTEEEETTDETDGS